MVAVTSIPIGPIMNLIADPIELGEHLRARQLQMQIEELLQMQLMSLMADGGTSARSLGLDS